MRLLLAPAFLVEDADEEDFFDPTDLTVPLRLFVFAVFFVFPEAREVEPFISFFPDDRPFFPAFEDVFEAFFWLVFLVELLAERDFFCDVVFPAGFFCAEISKGAAQRSDTISVITRLRNKWYTVPLRYGSA